MKPHSPKIENNPVWNVGKKATVGGLTPSVSQPLGYNKRIVVSVLGPATFVGLCKTGYSSSM